MTKMPVYSEGVPIHRAVIVRHTPRDHSRAVGGKNTGAISICGANVSSGLDYIGREGRYAERSDIEREPTPHDELLVSDRLDYIGRLGAYAERGAGRQEDATYWDQHGPVSRDVLEARMLRDGGAFVDSIVAVKREHMGALGLERKEDMQRLLRSTWQRSVEKWCAIRNPEDIRWVACYHTDADRSVHAHIYTWSAKGEIAPGYTVSREGTRAGKEEVYRVAYAGIREERNTRRNFIRDISRFEALRQAGLPVPRDDAKRLRETALRQGLEFKLSRSPDLTRAGREKVDELMARLRGSLDGGRGSLSRNWEANAVARDIIRVLEKESPSFAKLSSAHRECAEVMADLKGFGDSGFRAERAALLKGEREDFLKRVSSKLERAVIAETEPARERSALLSRDPNGRRAMERAARMPYLAHPGRASRDAASRIYGVSLKEVRGMQRDLRDVYRALGRPGARAEGRIPGAALSAALSYAERAASGTVLREGIERAALERAERAGIPRREAYDAVREQFIGSMAKAVIARAMDGSRVDGRAAPRDGIGMVMGLASALESAARSLAYCAIRGGMRGERDRSLDRAPDRPERL